MMRALLVLALAVSTLAAQCMIPPGRHTDWPWPLSHIPRHSTARCSNHLPEVICAHGLAGHDPDIPPPGGRSFSVSRYGFNIALTSKHRLHFRIGTFRYDYVGHYYEFPTIALKHIVR